MKGVETGVMNDERMHGPCTLKGWEEVLVLLTRCASKLNLFFCESFHALELENSLQFDCAHCLCLLIGNWPNKAFLFCIFFLASHLLFRGG